MRKPSRLFAVAFLLSGLGSTLSADIVPVTQEFNANAATEIGLWQNVGAVSGTISADGTSTTDAGIAGGDLLALDGGLRYDTVNTTQGDEAIALQIGGSLVLGEAVTFNYGLYNDFGSTNFGFAQLFNQTDGTVLAQSTQFIVNGNGNPSPVDGTLTYTALAGDVGDTLQIRFVDDNNNASRDLFVDNISVSSVTAAVPEPTSLALLGFGGTLLACRRRRR